MYQIPWNTNRTFINNCPLIDSVFLAPKSIFVNEKFVYVGNQKVAFAFKIEFAPSFAAQSEFRFTVSTPYSAARPPIKIAWHPYVM